VTAVRRWLRGAWELVGADLPIFSLAAVLVVGGGLLSAGVLLLPLWTGLLLMCAEKQAGRSPGLGQLAEGLLRFPAAFGVWAAYLLGSLPFVLASAALRQWLHVAREWGRGAGWVGLLIEVAGHVVVTTPLLLALPLIADRDLGGLEAMRHAWRRTRTILPLLFVSASVLTGLLLLGVFACGVGLVLTVPVAAGLQWLAYRELGVPSVGDWRPVSGGGKEGDQDAAES